jgi:hypothetical protein
METPKSRIPTAAEVLRRQREEHGGITPTPKPTATTGDNVQAYLNEHAGGMAGAFVKFAKDGRFRKTSDDEEIPEGRQFAVIYDLIQVGWVRFNGKGVPPDRRMGPLFEGFVPCQRDELGDNDEAKWDVGIDGQPQSPWQDQCLVPLQDVETGALYIFGTTSVTGRRSTGALIAHCRQLQRRQSDAYPIIALRIGGFQHRDERIGIVKTPMFAPIGTTPKNNMVTPAAAITDDLSDAMPF